MSANVSKSLGSNLHFTYNTLEKEKEANARSKIQLVIIVLAHKKCKLNIECLN
jgi:hypothetical protein